MTQEQMEQAIELLVNHHARVSVEIEGLKEAVAGLIQSTASLERQAESDCQETREAINNLIVVNEVTRDLAQKVAALQIQMSARVTDIDRRVTDLEST